MSPLKRHPLFFSVLGLCALALAAAGYLLFAAMGDASAARQQAVAKEQELAGYATKRPFPNRINADAVEAEQVEVARALATMRDALRGQRELATGSVPATRPAAFFNLTDFVENTRRKAQESNVRLRDNERFSFASHANAGPEIELIGAVHEQRLVMEYLIDALFAARPEQLLQVQRERPFPKAYLQAVADAANSGDSPPPPPPLPPSAGDDYFSIDPRVTARVPGFIEASAYRVVFIGQTQVLRGFLNKLSTFELPLAVRSVEIERVTDEQQRQAGTPRPSLANIFGAGVARAVEGDVAAPLPIVPTTFSRFTVTVELIRLVSASADGATPAP